jgi:hypothetical protein
MRARTSGGSTSDFAPESLSPFRAPNPFAGMPHINTVQRKHASSKTRPVTPPGKGCLPDQEIVAGPGRSRARGRNPRRQPGVTTRSRASRPCRAPSVPWGFAPLLGPTARLGWFRLCELDSQTHPGGQIRVLAEGRAWDHHHAAHRVSGEVHLLRTACEGSVVSGFPTLTMRSSLTIPQAM